MSETDDAPTRTRADEGQDDSLDAFLLVLRQALLMIVAWIERRQHRSRRTA